MQSQSVSESNGHANGKSAVDVDAAYDKLKTLEEIFRVLDIRDALGAALVEVAPISGPGGNPGLYAHLFRRAKADYLEARIEAACEGAVPGYARGVRSLVWEMASVALEDEEAAKTAMDELRSQLWGVRGVEDYELKLKGEEPPPPLGPPRHHRRKAG